MFNPEEKKNVIFGTPLIKYMQLLLNTIKCITSVRF